MFQDFTKDPFLSLLFLCLRPLLFFTTRNPSSSAIFFQTRRFQGPLTRLLKSFGGGVRRKKQPLFSLSDPCISLSK